MQFRLILIFYFILFIGITSCADKIEGCLDINAVNFDVDADVDCCCTYPDLVVNFNHVFGDTTFRIANEYPYNTDLDTFLVNEMSILFSNIHPIQNGVPYLVDDQIAVNVNDTQGEETLELEDNFIVMTPTKFSYSVNGFSRSGTYDGVELLMGLDADARRIIPDSVFVTDHVLQSEQDSIWEETIGYFYLYLDVVPDKDLPDISKKIVIYGDDSVELEFFGEIFGDIGYDFEIDLKIDYKILFDGINFDADDESAISQKILDNFPNAISLLE